MEVIQTSFKTPVVVVVGRVGEGVGVWSSEGSTLTLKYMPGTDYLDELVIHNSTKVHGHLALASYGQYILKAVDLKSRAGSYTIIDGEFVQIPSKAEVNLRKFDDWFTIKNTFIAIGNPYVVDYNLIICPYRLGDTLYLSFGYASSRTLLDIIGLLEILKSYIGEGRISTTCLCRIPTMPLEIALYKGDKYLLIRTYVNDMQKSPGSKYLVILTKGGNLIERHVGDTCPLDVVSGLIAKMESV